MSQLSEVASEILIFRFRAAAVKDKTKAVYSLSQFFDPAFCFTASIIHCVVEMYFTRAYKARFQKTLNSQQENSIVQLRQHKLPEI